MGDWFEYIGRSGAATNAHTRVRAQVRSGDHPAHTDHRRSRIAQHIDNVNPKVMVQGARVEVPTVIHVVKDFPGGLRKDLRAHDLGSADILGMWGRRKRHGRAGRNEEAPEEAEAERDH